MPLSKRKRAQSWKSLLHTKYELKDKGYELEIEEYVRKTIGSKRKEVSVNPWLNYIKKEKKEREKGLLFGNSNSSTVVASSASFPLSRSNSIPSLVSTPLSSFRTTPASHRASTAAPTSSYTPSLSLSYAEARSRPHTTATSISREDCFTFLPEEIIQEDLTHYHSPSQWYKVRAENT